MTNNAFNNEAFNGMVLNEWGNMPFQVYINGECHWAYKIEESVSVDDGTGNTAWIVVYQETRYLKGHAEAREWYENHPRHYSKRDDFPIINLFHMVRNGGWTHCF